MPHATAWRRPVVAAILLFATAALHAQAAKKPLTLDDYGRWNRITSTAISNDGKWMSYAYAPNEGDVTLYVKQLDGTTVHTIALGGQGAGGGRGGGGGFGGGGGGPTFSDDSKWIAYYVNPSEAAGRGGRSGGAPAPGGRGAQPPAPGRGGASGATAAGQRRLELLQLEIGTRTTFPNPASFAFSKGSKYFAVKGNRPPGADTSFRGSDLLVRDLATGTTRNIGNVNLYAFDDGGRQLAYTVDAADKLGNGVYLLDMATGVTTVLNAAQADYDQLAWSDEGANLAVLRGTKRRDMKQRDNVLLAWTNAGSPNAASVVLDPAESASLRGYVVSEYAQPRWSRDGSRLFLGVKEQEPEVAAADSTKANVDIWHWKDPEPQSVQIVRLQQERRATYPAAFFVASGQVVVFGDSAMRTAATTADGRWAVGRNDKAYRGSVEWGGGRADLYRINVATGERTLIAQKLTRTYGTSPDSKWFLYLKDRHVHTFNLDTGRDFIIDAALPKGMSFVNAEDDHDYEVPIYGVAGWSKDGRSVLLNHRFDIWQLSVDASAPPVNLTQGAGNRDQIVFRVARLGSGGGRGGRGGFGGDGAAADEAIDLTEPILLTATGQWTKKSGFYTLPPGGAPTPLRYLDKQIGNATKAANADRVIYTEQTFNEYPDYWVSDVKFANPTKITNANPFLAEYAWGSKVLVDYRNSKGQRLQGTLTLPAGYEKGRKYPMLVYFYEIMSNTHHTFSMPVFDDRPHISTYASNGYLVFQPDVVYEIGKPGSSAVDCVTSGVREVIRLGYADPKRIGLQGHSWGGYQSSFILTQTDMFAAVVTGAPPTNLVSFYNELYKQTGTVQQGITEVGQVRMGEDVTPWNAHELYESQSPIHNVTKIRTPFMILHGTADGAVDWIEGLQFFNAARRNGKQVILLSYPNEPHHLANKENQKDFQVRMKQFFDHYLMGTPMPAWMANGLPQVRKGEAIKPVMVPRP